jgi:hypothetical protein
MIPRPSTPTRPPGFNLEYHYLDGKSWAVWRNFPTQSAAVDMLRSAQIADVRDGIARVWRVVDVENETHRAIQTYLDREHMSKGSN